MNGVNDKPASSPGAFQAVESKIMNIKSGIVLNVEKNWEMITQLSLTLCVCVCVF